MLIHLKYRWMRWRVWIGIYVVFAIMMCFTNVQTSFRAYPIFEDWYEQQRGSVLLVILLVYLFLQVYLIHRDDHSSQLRIHLLPQKRRVRLFGDVMWMLVVMAVLTIGFLCMYALSFYTYISYLDEQDVLFYQQTRDLMVSLTRCHATSWILFVDVFDSLQIFCFYVLGAETVYLIHILMLNHKYTAYEFLLWMMPIVLGVIIRGFNVKWLFFLYVISLCIALWLWILQAYEKIEIGGN